MEQKKSNTISICLPYDMNNIYAFFCARYGNIKYNDLLEMGYEEFIAKLNSIPSNEPLYDIIKSRVIDLKKIKDKEERKYWQELKRVNKIPYIYKSVNELDDELKNVVKSGGINYGKKTR